MHDLRLTAVRDLEKSMELKQAPVDEVVNTASMWLAAIRSKEINCESGATEALEKLVTMSMR